MTNFNKTLGAGATLRLTVTQASQSVAGNASTDSWALYLLESNGQSFEANPIDWSVTINGTVHSGTFTFDFSQYSTKTIASGSQSIAHNADGTKTTSVSAAIDDTGTSIGGGSVSGSFPQTTIPRASKSTLSDSSFDAGTAITITTNRASSSFTHTITYTLGTASGTIGTGVGASTTWTPALSLCTQMPSALSKSGTITTKTFSGSTLIGTTSVNFTLSVPSSVVPTLTDVTVAETVSAVSTLVGAYVQTLSKLALAITGAAGAQGSTLSSYKLTVAGQTINSDSGTTAAIGSSGSLSVVGTITDSRGRTASHTTSITVLAYSAPKITAASVQRADATGTPADQGTDVRANFTGAASSLMVGGVEMNALTYSISTREHGDVPWTLLKSVNPGGITFTGHDYGATFDISHSWDVLVQVSDIFGAAQFTGIVPTATIFMHWDGSIGVGIGKYRENGALDIEGDIYAGTLTLTSAVDESATSTGHALQIGASDGPNMRADSNQIDFYNNGAHATANINTDATGGAGSVTLGTSGGTVSIPGDLNAASLPFRMASGKTSTAVNGTTVTLPASRFSVAPNVIASSGEQSLVCTPRVTNITTTSFLLNMFSLAGASTAGTNVPWEAIQMTSGSANG